MTRLSGLTGAVGALAAIGFVHGASGQGLIATHRVPAALAAEAVQTAVSTCASQGFAITAAFLDADGVVQALLRGDGAGIHTVRMAQDKAYTSISFRSDGSTIVDRAAKSGGAPAAITKLPHLILATGAIVVMGGSDGKELLGAIASSGVPNSTGDEVCAKAGLAKIADRLK